MMNLLSKLNRILFPVTLGVTLSLGISSLAEAADAPPILHPGENVKVLPLGDSITLGKNSGLGGYRRVLYEWLLEDGYSITYVGKQNLIWNGPATCSDGSIAWHEGYGSFRTDMILEGGSAEKQTAPPLTTTLEKFTPDVVLVMLGTNDILQDYELETLEVRFEKIIESIFAVDKNTTVVVATIPSIKRANSADKEARVQAYNTALAALVEKYAALGHKVVLADTQAALSPHGLSGDGVHPSSLGYAEMAQVFYRVLTGEEPPDIDKKNPLLMPPEPDAAATH